VYRLRTRYHMVEQPNHAPALLEIPPRLSCQPLTNSRGVNVRSSKESGPIEDPAVRKRSPALYGLSCGLPPYGWVPGLSCGLPPYGWVPGLSFELPPFGWVPGLSFGLPPFGWVPSLSCGLPPYGWVPSLSCGPRFLKLNKKGQSICRLPSL